MAHLYKSKAANHRSIRIIPWGSSDILHVGYAVTELGVVSIQAWLYPENPMLKLEYVHDRVRYSENFERIDKMGLDLAGLRHVAIIKTLHFIEKWVKTVIDTKETN